MPDSPLREQLMERLFAISSTYHQGPVSPQLHDPLWTGSRVVYGILADECFRQMEWARRNCIVDDSPESTGGPGGAMVRPSEYYAGTGRWPPKMTLAPEDWHVPA